MWPKVDPVWSFTLGTHAQTDGFCRCEFSKALAITWLAGEDKVTVGGEFEEGLAARLEPVLRILRGEVVESSAAMTVGSMV